MFVEDFSTPETEVGAQPDVYSVAGLAAWLRTQDPSTRYVYTDPFDCLLCRYFTARGVRHKGVTHNELMGVREFPESMKWVSQGAFSLDGDRWTYGAASSRLTALQGKG